MILHSMSITSSIVDFVSKHGLKDGDGVWLFFLGSVVLMVFACLAVGFILRPRKYRGFPIVGQHEDLYRGLVKGTRKYPNSAFAIPTFPPTVILPVQMIDEIKSLPETKISSAREIYRRAAGKYSKTGTNALAAVRALRIDLNRSGSIIPALREETDFAFSQAIGEYTDWTPVAVYPKINHIVAMVSGRVFLGTPLCRDAEWVALTTAWARDIFALVTKTAKYPTWIRPWIVPYLSETRKVLRLRASAKAFLSPAFSEQLEARSNYELPPEKMRDTLVSWMMKYMAPRHMNVESLVRHQLGISLASTHTTTHAVSNILFDLAAQPEYQDGLREELEAVLEKCGGELTQLDLAQLRKMDSFMKESQRFSPATIVSPMRLTIQPLTLSTGQIIPAGTPIGFFSMSINQSNSIYKSPPADIFDGYRFAREREKKGNENKHQFGSTGPAETFDFGHGIHACPGRFLAATEIKIMLAYVLQNYDLKLEPEATRPENSLDEFWFVADQKARVLLRSRKA